MRRKSLAVLLLVFMAFAFSSAFAENLPQIGDTTISLKDGYVRHPFDNGYTGFCISYGTPDAVKDDIYEVVSPDGILNTANRNVTDFIDYLKIYATQYSDNFLSEANDIVVQFIAWHFSNDFTGWRIDPEFVEEIVEEIKEKAAVMEIPDRGYTQQIGDMNRTWDFIILADKDAAEINDRALFFAYKVTETPIEEDPVLPGPAGPDQSGVELPKTGDESRLLLWSALAGASLIGIAALMRKKKEA